ncbi:leucine-rich repeat protein [uncultured Mediterranea sp.]|uniref:leucine-rich repeat protein n=1 Tax=uncultured Mediterranea sp. TaxID=1926662 RepID=UPI0027D9563D|nr:leucine-rich repeat protein [uncultured Mediterranea sp.]
MRRRDIIRSLAMLALFTTAACNDDTFGPNGPEGNSGRLITLSGEIEQVAVTRVNDNGFCDGDAMGVYIVDYQGDTPGTLQNNGNRGNNVKHTFDEAAYKWNSAYDVYWKDEHTHIDIYGYYPFGAPEDVNAYPFEVQKDQSTTTTNNEMGGYEASDFLWGKAADVAPTEKVIRLPMRHRMSSPRITLAEGEGFADGEWAGLEKQVLVRNVKRNALINLADGSITATGEVQQTGTIPYVKDNVFRAIVVPQTVSANTILFTITVDGVVYNFSKPEDFTYVSGKMHNFTIQVNKKEPTGEFTFTLVGESITAWENDDVSHDATMKEYIVINSTPGHLKDSITAAGKDYRELQNLKITGEINALDFYFMRDSMTLLKALNLKPVKIARTDTLLHFGSGSCQPRTYLEDEIPEGAMSNKTSLLQLILPDKLKIINVAAFTECKNLTGSLIIPDGVTKIEAGAFYNCKSLTGTLSLPNTVTSIGDGWDRWWYGGTFGYCGFTCELILPTNLEYIGTTCFAECTNLYGSLHLPDKLKTIEAGAFHNCRNLTGNLTIPQEVTAIPETAFASCGFDGTLTLHDGIVTIGEAAFQDTHFKGELTLPKDLVVLSNSVFCGCDFSGKLKLPQGLRTIGSNVFGSYSSGSNWRLMGTLEIPEGVLSIGQGAFYNCWGLEGIILPESLESIQNEAFYQCYGIGSIVCKGAIPPHVQVGAFDGVAKDNFTLEVPESAIQQYQAAVGWSDFKRIAAHRELVCRPSIANAINTQCTRTLVIDAEGDWTVESMPEWCSLSQNEGSKKTEVTLTIHEMSAGSPMRTGEIVFKLKDQDYRHKCTVSQYDYAYAEDEVITLQTATKGNHGGINLVFLGDGYDAKDISEGKYMKDMQDQVENFFGIEPYKTYRNYFNVYTGIAVSPETGIGTINTIRYAKFETTYTGGVGLRCDYDAVFDYAQKVPTVTKDNLKESLIIMVPNSTDYGGICQMWEDGSAIAFCPLSTYGYPLDTRGVIQHEAGGHGFGKLGDEYIYHNEFIDFCGCGCCGHVYEFNIAKSLGWYENLSLTGKMHEVPWSQLIFDEKYSDFVDIFEGGYMHSRGVFRSEQNSCMNNDIPYYSTISRMAIVKRIKQYAGETFTYEDFKANDVVNNDATTRSFNDLRYSGSSVHNFQLPPTIHKGSPLDK